MSDLSLLSRAVVSGDRDKAVQLAMEAVSAGVNPEDIITKGLQLGMMTVGEKFSSGEYFLPDMLMAARATLKVSLDFPEEPVVVRADREQLRMAFANLVTNAVQAMKNKGTLTVQLLKENDKAALSFTDTGPGITPENMGRLFQPLFSTKPRGIGFGLPIGKMVAEKNGGSIEARSAPGAGATFTVRLPLHQEVPKENP